MKNGKKSIFMRWWFWLIVVVVGVGACGSSKKSDGSDSDELEVSVSSSVESVSETSPADEPESTFVIELVAGEQGEYGELYTLNEETQYIYHIPAGTYSVTNDGDSMSQFNIYTDETHMTDEGWEEPAESLYVKLLDVGESDTFSIEDGQYIEIQEPGVFQLELLDNADDNVSTEYKSALASAKTYASFMYMSKQAIYDQLTSEYGDKFPADAAQYAVDNLDWDWNANALAKAEDYSDTMHMSKQGIYDQLVSEYGEQFTEEEAQYAVDNMDADWNANALAKAKDYQDTMSMSKSDIYDQLVSEYGEKFTADEAQYAIDHLE